MEGKNNVIDLAGRRQAQTEKNEVKSSKSAKDASVTDISQIRQEIIQEERRKVKRTILTEFVGATVVVPGLGLKKVSLHDISEGGVAFDIDMQSGNFKVGEEIAVRVYINHQTYFPFTARVTHVEMISDENVTRHGTAFLKDTINEKALYHFVKFIENVSAALKSDKGDVMVSNIK